MWPLNPFKYIHLLFLGISGFDLWLLPNVSQKVWETSLKEVQGDSAKWTALIAFEHCFPLFLNDTPLPRGYKAPSRHIKH
jgi:hypothetical protein